MVWPAVGRRPADCRWSRRRPNGSPNSCLGGRRTADLRPNSPCGGHDQAVAELRRRLLADHPLREGLWAAADARPGRRGPACRGTRGLRPGPGRHLRPARRGSRRRTAPAAPRRTPRQGHPPPARNTTAPVLTPSRRTPPLRPRRRAAPAEPPGPAQLPADIADFTGRDEQVKRLSDLLSGTGASGDPGAVRIAVVAGAGGLGKTSLAVHAAHRVRRRFPDGQLYVDLLGATRPRSCRGRAGQVPARSRGGRPGHPGGRGRARGQVPDHPGPPPDAGGAGQRARRGAGPAAAAGLRVPRCWSRRGAGCPTWPAPSWST